jgi:hypothetical protein
MLTPRSRTPMALFQSPACSLQFWAFTSVIRLICYYVMINMF